MTHNYIEQSAVIAYRIRKRRYQLLLVTSLDRARWVLPKGGIQQHLSASASAGREAYEEAGLMGIVYPDEIGIYWYRKPEYKNDLLCQVKVFFRNVNRVLKDWPEQRLRIRKWMSFNEASSCVEEPELRILLNDAEKKLLKITAATTQRI